MFTGIIEQVGVVVANTALTHGHRLEILANFEQIALGESIAVNGVCLTITDHKLTFDLSQETINCTALGQLQPNDRVNLERALTGATRMGGHYVSGHVDKTALIETIQPMGDYIELCLSGFTKAYQGYLFAKGSITIDGVSLTINRVIADTVNLMLIPHTLKKTTLGHYASGHKVNIEFDYLARIVAHQLQCRKEIVS